MKSKICFSVLSILLIFGTVVAQKTWEKPMQKWSKEDVIKILNTSPWVQTYQSTEGMAAIDKEQIAKTQNDLRINTSTTSQNVSGSTTRTLSVVPVIIRLHSALPIRQALVRLQQIEAGYDKMDEKKRTAFDKAMTNILDCPLCQDYYVVTMAKAINSSRENVEDGLFQTMKNEQLKGNIWLVNEKGEKQELEQFIPPKSATDLALFFFKRKTDKGTLFLTPEDKHFKFVFNNTFLNSNNAYSNILPRSFEFKVSSITVNGDLSFQKING